MGAPEPRQAGTADIGSKGRSVMNGEFRAKVQAARLRLVTDRKQGKQSPQWVKHLANDGRR